MNTKLDDFSPSSYARIAGVLYLIIAVAAIFAHAVVPGQFLVPGDAAATAANINTSPFIFRLGTVGSELVILLSEIVLSVVLYMLFKPVDKTLSLVAAVSRLAMTAIHGLNLLNYYFALRLLRGGEQLAAFSQEQLNSLAALFLEAHGIGFALGIAFLVPHVLVLGYLIYKSGYFPKVLGILFVAAGAGYLLDTVGLLLLPGYDTTPAVIALVITVAELAFPIWLLVKGVNEEGWQARAVALEAA